MNGLDKKANRLVSLPTSFSDKESLVTNKSK